MNRIRSFGNRETEKIYNQEYVKNISSQVQEKCLRKLIMIDVSASLQDLRVPPGNRLEKLTGNLGGKYSIRINEQYRIIFTEENGFYYDVEIVDYH